MARKRMIDPSFWTDEKLGECTIQERLLFMGLISNADDEGYGRANPKLLKSLIFPYDDLRASDLEKWLSHLGGLHIVVLYEYNGQTYYNLPNFLKHQTINKPTATSFPKLDIDGVRVLTEHYGSITVGLPPKRREEKRIEKEEKKKEFIAPSLEEIQKYVAEKKLNVDSRKFYNYFTEGNWIDSKGNKVKNWKQKLLTWNGFSDNKPNIKNDKPKNALQTSDTQYQDLDKYIANL